MNLPVISVIIPTVSGREDHLARCVNAYTTLGDGNYELDLIIEHDHATCGLAWQTGWEKATGDYIHLTDDDIEPRLGWHTPAIEAVKLGYLPAPLVFDPTGVPRSWPIVGQVGEDWTSVHMTSLPFASRAQMEKIVPLFTAHYYTDDFFSIRGIRAGWTCALRTGYTFTHWYAQVKRGAGMSESARMDHDKRLYDQAMAMVNVGTWDQPWPPDGNSEV